MKYTPHELAVAVIGKDTGLFYEQIKRAIEIAVEHEREACAKVADDIACEEGAAMICGEDAYTVKRDVATAIRARGDA